MNDSENLPPVLLSFVDRHKLCAASRSWFCRQIEIIFIHEWNAVWILGFIIESEQIKCIVILKCFLKGTATFTINRHLACLWSKIGTFQVSIELCKRATLPILREMFRNTNESFQMSYCMQFFFQGHQNCQNLKIYTSEFT